MTLTNAQTNAALRTRRAKKLHARALDRAAKLLADPNRLDEYKIVSRRVRLYADMARYPSKYMKGR